MDGKFSNIGVKVHDLDKEVRFFVELGARIVYRETRTQDGRQYEVALLECFGTRVFLTMLPVFEGRLPGPLPSGLSHVVWEVPGLDEEYRRVKAAGAEELMPPREITSTVGRRRVSFFRSPNGLIFEVMQVLEARVE